MWRKHVYRTSPLHTGCLRGKGGILPGKLPAFWDKELMIGMKMPPALAVVDGMAGAIAASANPSPYANPRVLLPKAFTNRVATRSPV